jgi:hypothetical protein
MAIANSQPSKPKCFQALTFVWWACTISIFISQARDNRFNRVDGGKVNSVLLHIKCLKMV